MSNETVTEDQSKDCSFFTCCIEFISENGYKKSCGQIIFDCIFFTIMVVVCYWICKKIPAQSAINAQAAQAEAAILQEIADLEAQAELQRESIPDPLSDLSENFNKINICHETQFPNRHRSDRSVVLYV